jgi:hypothetical protein
MRSPTITSRRLLGALTGSLVLLAAGCAGDSAVAADEVVAAGPDRSGISPSDLPDPCALLAPDTIVAQLGGPTTGAGTTGKDRSDDPLLYRTCTWGDLDIKAIGVQIGTANRNGHDVVLNRVDGALEPSIDFSGVAGGRESTNVGLMPTGGALGATVFFQANGYSVIVAKIGGPIPAGDVEDLAMEIFASVSNL